MTPVRRFRSVEDMEPPWRPIGPELWRAIRAVWGLAKRTCPRSFPPGVYKHRSIESAQRLREEWDAEAFRRFWELKGQAPPRD